MSMDDEDDEEECESVNERCVNVNKVPQEHVTKAGPDNLLEKNLKRIIYKMPRKHKTPSRLRQPSQKELEKNCLWQAGSRDNWGETTGAKSETKTIGSK